jgi:hypothetical protein
MSLENFRLPQTPESRTYRVVLLLLCIALVVAVTQGLWRLLVGSPFAAGTIALAGAAAASAYAVVRYLRQRRT